MGNLPTLKVLLDDGTGAFPYDISRYVMSEDGYSITRGRDDWQAAVTAGSLTLTLNNSDGRFTPGSTLIASPSPIVVDRRIWVIETINGNLFNRFVGHVKAWPVEWPEVVPTFAKVRLTAVDAQARAERRPLRSCVTEEVLIDTPTAYYPLSEAAGSTAAGDLSGNAAPSLGIVGSGTALAFGSSVAPEDGLTSVQFNGGTYLQNTRPAVYIPAGAAYTLECFFSTTATTANTALLMSVDQAFGFGFSGLSPFLGVTAAGKLSAGFGFVSSASVNDGVVHHAFFAVTAGGVGNLFLDGVSVAFGAGAAVPSSDMIGLTIAQAGLAGLTSSFVGTIAHAAVYPSAVGAARPAIHGAARNGFAGETGTARIARLAGYAGVPIGTLETSLTTLAASPTNGSSAWSDIQDAVDAEMGSVFVDGFGALDFHNRNRVVAMTAPNLTLSSQYVTPDVAPVVDDQQIVNYVEVTTGGTGATSMVRSTSSEGTTAFTGHGRYSGSRTYEVQTDAEAIDRASWLVSNFAEPVTRYGTLTINLYKMTPALAATVVNALEVDCWLRITSMAPQNPGGATTDVIVQGWQESCSGENWTITCNVVSRSLYSPVWIFDTSQFDTTTRFYV